MEINQGARSYVVQTAHALLNALEVYGGAWPEVAFAQNAVMAEAEAFRIALRALGNNAPRPGPGLVELARNIISKTDFY